MNYSLGGMCESGTVKPLYTVLLRGNKNAGYREVHGIERYVLHINTAKHGIWGKNTVHGISRNTVLLYREARYRHG